MKITLDQETLAQAVTHHLRTVGVTADIVKVDFRYTRVPYTVFAEVELSEARIRTVVPRPQPVVVEAQGVLALEPVVDPSTLPPEEPEPTEQPVPTAPSAPLFGD